MTTGAPSVPIRAYCEQRGNYACPHCRARRHPGEVIAVPGDTPYRHRTVDQRPGHEASALTTITEEDAVVPRIWGTTVLYRMRTSARTCRTFNRAACSPPSAKEIQVHTLVDSHILQ